MPVANDSGSGRGGRSKGPKKEPLLTLPPAAGSQSSSGVTSASSSTATTPPSRALSGGVKGGAKAGSSAASSSSSTTSDYTKAQRARDTATRDRYIVDAEQMSGQIKALQSLLGPKGSFKDALKIRLRNIDRVLGQQMDDLDKAEGARNASLDADARNNALAQGDGTSRNDSNRSRERTMALAELAAQGGGESDALRAQLMSLRSGESNQAEIDRAFHDTERGINSSRLDLALDSHNARVNMVTEALADKEQLHTTFHNQLSETQTQLGNALGQQAEYYGLAIEANRNAHGPGVKTTTSTSSSASTKGGKSRGGLVKGGKGAGKPGYLDGSKGPDWQEPGGRLRPQLGGSRPDASDLSDPKGPQLQASPLHELGRGGKGGKLGKGGKGNGGGKKYGKGLKGAEAQASAESDAAFMAAANQQGKAWRNPGLPQDLKNWQPPAAQETTLPSSLLQNARTTMAVKAPEGATLRKW